MLVNIANDFVAITSNCYFIFLSLQNVPLKQDHVLKVIGKLYLINPNTDKLIIYVGSIFWSIPHLANVLFISAICHYTVQKVSL